ncbi:Thiosulfate sulfurtransferase [Geodia barretti]|uniref:Thiosulfate sulfurtransferase n=1 Tax=Geodia barretti TaxID=519541 RepID=A0AA35S1K7_GEOBA|nr:Thiosulfate sulfurtransferase [Geodia barretti]
MIPSPHRFQTLVAKMGVGNGDHVVVYDGHSEGLMASARVWWMFRLFGHERVSVLDGESEEMEISLHLSTLTCSGIMSRCWITTHLVTNRSLLLDCDNHSKFISLPSD